MKHQIIEEKVKHVLYTCEKCGKESKHHSTIELCEKRHTCIHVPKMELIENDECCFTYTGIQVKCKLCGVSLKYFPSINFEDIEDDQLTLRRLYILLRRGQSIDKKERGILNRLQGRL